jgi:hypothetical protein
MKRFTVFLITAIILLTGSECENSPEPMESSIGNLKITITYPEAVIENGEKIGYKHVPGVGAEVSLFYNNNAKCLGYKDATLGRALEGDTLVQPKYVMRANEKGEIMFQFIQAGEYYLIVVARAHYSYSEKYVQVTVGDTLELKKDFSYKSS